MIADDVVSLMTKLVGSDRDRPRRPFLTPSLFGIFLLAAFAGGCAPSPTQDPTGSGPNGLPELTDAVINDQINYTRVTEIPEENGSAGPISWRFDEDEPREVRIVEKKVEGSRATVVLDVKTKSSPRAPIHRTLAGQIRTEWELQSGWVLRKWEIVNIENISLKYKDLPKPLPTNSNREETKKAQQ